ncbi:hypothetical protein BV20DRAFT_1118498 [Pilatotrama ljubarskyi]|nr:hypothetical protein BV20DRAFT_1118498 [Pilatotrama ljubarskyi]
MSERGVGKPWTTYEDNLLIQAVAIHGENDNWKAVALSVPGRTNKACRKRWLHSLSPNVKKTAWTPEEDQLLLSLYAIHGTKWSVIARNIPGRTDDACSKRYREALDPSLKRDDWTAEEDAKLLEAYSRLGGKWGLIGQELSRSGLGCRNRWRMLERKRVAATRDGQARPEQSPLSAQPGQWTPNHDPNQEAQAWDGRSPQYVTPSMLFNSSPNHPPEMHTAAYLPEQILSGAHLAGGATGPQEPGQFQYGSSSLSGASSHPGSAVHSPNPHAYYASAHAFSPHHIPEVSGAGAPTALPQSGGYRSGQYGLVADPGGSAAQASLETYQEDGHRHAGAAPATPCGGDVFPSRIPGAPGPLVISDSPASPSPRGSPSPLETPPGTPPAQQPSLSSDTVPVGSANKPTSYYRTEAEKAQQSSVPRRASNPQRPTRLSSLLPATADASVLAYACGHRECWPADAPSSKSAFATSKELSDHSKIVHGGDLGGNKPFRCGLTGCEKSWKSINGLQYHLQISKVHFQYALATRRDTPVTGSTAVQPAESGTEGQDVPETHAADGPPNATTQAGLALVAPASEVRLGSTSPPKPRRKLHPCPRPGCGKQYKQLSGLRYHLSHGHVEELPMQLDVVPPTLARMVAEKGR